MSNLKFNINANEIASAFGDLKGDLEADLVLAVKSLSASTYARIAEKAQNELKSTRSTYIDALDWQEVEAGVWVVSLDMKKAGFIEDGRKAGDQRDDLLKGAGVKTSSEGYKYRVIPFSHSKAPSDLTEKHKELVAQIKSELKKRKLTYKKLEVDANGSPRIGTLHRFNIASDKPSANASHPALHGVTIIQNKGSDGNVRRQVMTFRVISDNPTTKNKWQHPGLEARHFFEKAFAEAEAEWPAVLDEILQRYSQDRGAQ